MNQEQVTISGHQMVALSSDAGHILHRVGSADYPEIRHTTVLPDSVDEYEEVAVEDVPTAEDAEYQSRVTELVREKYDARSEADILRRAVAVILHPSVMTLAETDDDAVEDPAAKALEDFEEYNGFVDECYEKARSADPRIETEATENDME